MESSLELFLLALIDSGLATPYEFYNHAGISVGASLPALNSLLRQKLVSRGKAGNRRRMAYRLTGSGRTALKNWSTTQAPKQESGDVASALRFSTLAYFLSSPAQAKQILERAGAHLAPNAEPPTNFDLSSPATAYKWMQSVRDQYRHEADLRSLNEIRKKLKRVRIRALR